MVDNLVPSTSALPNYLILFQFQISLVSLVSGLAKWIWLEQMILSGRKAVRMNRNLSNMKFGVL